MSFPLLLFAIALVAIVGPSLPVTILLIAFFSWAPVGRVVRGQTLALKEREFVEAARSLGASNLRIMFVDILPNLAAPIIVYATLLVPAAIAFEATLSFLGLGVVPPTAEWGNMLAEAVGFYQVAWWFLVFPGAALIITTLAFNLLGDAVARRPRPPRRDIVRRADPGAASHGRGSGLRRMDLLAFVGRRLLQGLVVLLVISIVVFVMFFGRPITWPPPGRPASHDPNGGRCGQAPRPQPSCHRPVLELPVGAAAREPRLLVLQLRAGVFAHRVPRPGDDLGGRRRRHHVARHRHQHRGPGGGHPRSLADRSATGAALVFYSMPPFLLGLILLFFLFFQFHLAGIDLFPGSGYVGLFSDPPGGHT